MGSRRNSHSQPQPQPHHVAVSAWLPLAVAHEGACPPIPEG
jgi:hypothetical protein